MSRLNREERLGLARQYVEQLEKDRNAEASDTLARLMEGEENLFQGVGKLTRELHDSVKEVNRFINDPRLSEITQHELPDAKQRLSYVVEMTEQAANTTLTAVEESTLALERLAGETDGLGREWRRFRAREMKVEEFRELSGRLDTFFNNMAEQSQAIHSNQSEILMAQSYQDITGQVVKRVSQLVQDVEAKLVELLRISGMVPPNTEQGAARVDEALGPVVPGVNDEGRVSGQDEVDDLLSELGF